MKLLQSINEAVELKSSKASLLVGRFQPFHVGHEYAVKQMKFTPVVAIVKGKKSSKNKDENPLSEEFQEKMIKSVFPHIKTIIVDNAYIPAIIGKIKDELNIEVGEVVASKDPSKNEDRIAEFKDQILRANSSGKFDPIEVEFNDVPRKGSATKVREAIRDGREVDFKKMMPKALWNKWPQFREILSINITEDVDYSDISLELHDELNPKLWKETKLKPEVKEHLLNIANSFVDYLDIPKTSVKDIVLVGGNANYNYTKYSDVDVHLIVNIDEITTDKNTFQKFVMSSKGLWACEHDIKIFGYPVELYAQDIREKPPANQGEYSLMFDGWLCQPVKADVNLADPALLLKIREMRDQIDDAVQTGKGVDDIKEKIRNMRKSALEKAGEFAIENLVFKSLRNTGYLNKLSDFSKEKFDASMTLN